MPVRATVKYSLSDACCSYQHDAWLHRHVARGCHAYHASDGVELVGFHEEALGFCCESIHYVVALPIPLLRLYGRSLH